MRITVVVCTYNRAACLKTALASLLRQTFARADYEIVVIDNNSQDNTRQVVQEFMRQSNNVRYIFEPAPGVSHARNRGASEARGEYVGYMDDDAKAAPDWLDKVSAAFRDVIPQPIGVGGEILPFYSSPKPFWFKDAYEVRSWGNEARFLKPYESFSGSNMFFRKDVVQICGGFSPALGPKGDYLSLGEETLLFQMLWEKRGKDCCLYYAPDIRVYHWVPASKMHIRYIAKREFAYGQEVDYTLRRQLGQLSRWRAIADSTSQCLRTLHRAFYVFMNHGDRSECVLNCVRSLTYALGLCMGMLRLPIRIRQR